MVGPLATEIREAVRIAICPLSSGLRVNLALPEEAASFTPLAAD